MIYGRMKKMALIKCPECGKEVSDKAETCPGCGYVLKQNKKKITQANFSKKNKMAILLGSVIVIVAVLAGIYIKNITEKSPFENLTPDIKMKQVKELLGKPDWSNEISSYLQDYVDTYDDVKFMKLNGYLEFYYEKEDQNTIDFAIWNYDLNEDSTLNDYQKQINKIIDFYTELYGAPTSEYRAYEWKDYNGAEIDLDFSEGKKGIPDSIRIYYSRA